MENIRIAVCGACGRMGQRITALALAGGIKVVAGVDRVNNCGNSDIKIVNSLSDVVADCDVVIDFSSIQNSLANAEICFKNNKAIVIGTTGLKNDDIKKLEEYSNKIPVVFSPNMSIGVNLLFKLVKDVSKVLKDYDIEIVELHHNQKKDSPSGTAEKLAQIIADSVGRNIDEVGVYGRKGIIGARKKEEIGVMSVRAGDIVGEHTVYYAGPGERVELTHRAHSRDTFAQGALVAAKWLVSKKNGFFDMQDVLGL